MLIYKAAGYSDVGNVKEINQDSFLLKMGQYGEKRFLLAVVADGMGGVREGEVASRSLTVAFRNWMLEELEGILENDDEIPLKESLVESWEEVIYEVCMEMNAYGYMKGYRKEESPGSTICVLFLYDGKYYIANIGDSRVYRKRDGIKQITVDHSWAEMAREKGFSEEEIENDKRSNAITRCVGAGFEEQEMADYYTGDCYEGDGFLLCTDGLRRIIDMDSISGIFEDRSSSMKEKCEAAVMLAKNSGETDNITAVMISVLKYTDTPTEQLN